MKKFKLELQHDDGTYLEYPFRIEARTLEDAAREVRMMLLGHTKQPKYRLTVLED